MISQDPEYRDYVKTTNVEFSIYIHVLTVQKKNPFVAPLLIGYTGIFPYALKRASYIL